MASIPKSLHRLIECLAKLPGVGQKSAQRFAFFLLRSPKEYTDSLIKAITDVRNTVGFCSVCNSLSEEKLCGICSDSGRDKSVICVVEGPNDIISVEKTGQFNGRYFCLMGALSPLDNIGPEDLKLDKLVELIKREKAKEVIIATDSDQEGDTTALYIVRLLKGANIRLTRIAFGIPVGSNIEYADQATLIKAFEGRRQF